MSHEIAVYTGGAAPAGGDASGRGEVAKAGDFVILWGSYVKITGVVLKPDGITNNVWGNFHHDDIIGTTFGTKVYSRKGGAWMALLKATPELITQSLAHRTQIIYHADISLILMLVDAVPGRVIVESGTGSGSCSASFARALRPGGKLYTFEFHEERQQQAVEDFKRYGFDDVIESRHRNVCEDGFGAELDGRVDGVFLDLPMPWVAIQHAERCLVPGGKVCSFSPCIEQIDKTAAELRRRNFYDIRMFETLATNWGVKQRSDPSSKPEKGKKGGGKSSKRKRVDESGKTAEEAPGESNAPARPVEWLSYQMPQRSHTSFIMVATKPLPDDLDFPP